MSILLELPLSASNSHVMMMTSSHSFFSPPNTAKREHCFKYLGYKKIDRS
jgi:hypothetical protein